jgi:hypothetical protein
MISSRDRVVVAESGMLFEGKVNCHLNSPVSRSVFRRALIGLTAIASAAVPVIGHSTPGSSARTPVQPQDTLSPSQAAIVKSCTADLRLRYPEVEARVDTQRNDIRLYAVRGWEGMFYTVYGKNRSCQPSAKYRRIFSINKYLDPHAFGGIPSKCGEVIESFQTRYNRAVLKFLDAGRSQKICSGLSI